ncbi:MAG: hypothetical protein IJU76_14350 [Desulfovibrionaceae bacterium]|nr:hypothetical protein [Desulfovibrionaceae bacterium]
MSITLQKERKNIFSLSFGILNKSARATASYIDGNIIVTEIQEIVAPPAEWLPDMLQEIEEKSEKGWVCLIEDKTASLKTSAILYDFDEIGESRRTNLSVALDWYFSMQARGAIILREDMQRYVLKYGTDMSAVDLDDDDRGRIRYRLQWSHLTAGHRALLMCVAGAMMEEPLSERWMRVMAGNYKRMEKPNIFATLEAIKRLDMEKQAEFEKRWEADPDVLR